MRTRLILLLLLLALGANLTAAPDGTGDGSEPEGTAPTDAAPADTAPADATPTDDETPEPLLPESAIDPTEGAFVDVVDVNVVNVEVYVTDKDGNRVTGLTKDDFELTVDGRPVAISNFYAVEDGRARLPEAPAPAGEADEPAARPRLEIDRPEVPEDQRLNLVVYVDNFNLHPFTRNKVFRFIRTWLRQKLQPGDRVMLVSYDRSRKVRHPFTSDPELIATQLYELEEVSAMATSFDSDRRDILRDIYEADDIYRIRGRAIQYAESIFNDLRFSIDSLKALVESLAGLPGRKAILYVSDGLSMRAGEDIFYALNDHFEDSSVMMEIHRFDASRYFNELANNANANRVSFYNLDAAGLRTYTYMDVANASLVGGSHIDSVHFSNMQSPLVFLSQETGGISVINTNNFAPALDRIADDFSTYYSLGFASAEGASGRYHKIKVDVKNGRKLAVRSREGYRDKPVSTRMSESTVATLHFGFQDNPLGIVLQVGNARPAQSKHYNVDIKVLIPLGKLSYLPQDDFHRARVRLYISAKDEEGRLAPVSEVPIPINIPVGDLETAKNQFFSYDMTLQMRRGRQVVAVGARDEIGAVASYATQGIAVGL